MQRAAGRKRILLKLWTYNYPSFFLWAVGAADGTCPNQENTSALWSMTFSYDILMPANIFWFVWSSCQHRAFWQWHNASAVSGIIKAYSTWLTCAKNVWESCPMMSNDLQLLVSKTQQVGVSLAVAMGAAASCEPEMKRRVAWWNLFVVTDGGQNVP